MMLIVIVTIATCMSAASAQAPAAAGKEANQSRESEPAEAESSRLPEAEFVASDTFRSASLVQCIWKRLTFDGHYFGGEENNVGYTAGSWTFGEEHWKIAPGIGVAFGDNGFRTMPAVSLRWGYERGWFVTEGLFVQGLLHTKLFPEGTEPEGERSADDTVVPSIADGNHLSVRWQRITAGATWEHMQFREGKEWKGGGRLAYRILPHISLTLFVLGPGSEVRGGILLKPEAEK